jgi:4-aminobutyrate aminotransferase
MSSKNNPMAGMNTEGDLNLSNHRRQWTKENIDALTQRLLDEDALCFLHQSLSTPCLNVIKSASGSGFEDAAGRR